MSVLDKMCGSWKLDPSKTENQEAYLDAMGLSGEIKSKMMNEKNITADMTKEGDIYKTVTTFGDYVEKFDFKLGEKFKSHFMEMEIDNIFRLEGDVLLGEHDVQGRTTKSRRYLKSDTEVVIESETKGVKVKYTYTKC